MFTRAPPLSLEGNHRVSHKLLSAEDIKNSREHKLRYEEYVHVGLVTGNAFHITLYAAVYSGLTSFINFTTRSYTFLEYYGVGFTALLLLLPIIILGQEFD